MRAPPAISALIIGAVNVAVGTAAYAVALPSPSDSPNNETFSDMVPRAKCPDGQDYSSFDEDFRSIGPNLWTIDSGASGIKASSDGLILTLSKEMVSFDLFTLGQNQRICSCREDLGVSFLPHVHRAYCPAYCGLCYLRLKNLATGGDLR